MQKEDKYILINYVKNYIGIKVVHAPVMIANRE